MYSGFDKLLLTDEDQKEQDAKWYVSLDWIKSQTPSRLRGMRYIEELQMRRSAIRFLLQLSEKFGKYMLERFGNGSKEMANDIGKSITRVFATAAVWFHRFFMVHPFQVFNRFEVATTCFYLAAKAEDLPQNIVKVIEITQNIMKLTERPPLFQDDNNSVEEELKDLEHFLLNTMGFFIWVRHPHLYIHGLMDQLIGEQDNIRRIQDCAVKHATCSLSSSFCIRIDPRKFAIFCISWAAKDVGFPLNTWKSKPMESELTHWVQSFNLTMEEMNTIYYEYLEHVKVDNAEHNIENMHVNKLTQNTNIRRISYPQATSILQHLSKIGPFCSVIKPNNLFGKNEDLPVDFDFGLNKRKKIKLDHNYNFTSAATAISDATAT